MSDPLPAAETPPVKNPNAPELIKLRTAAALVRQIQKLAPILDDTRTVLTELQDVIDVHGAIADEDLTQLGVSAAQVASLQAFLTKLFEFMDNSTQTRKPYRTTINSVRRVGAQL
ncbi:MAG: hypothetical protein IPK16_30765 [Anaerolineales bacterium]|nr:hypothetical protein [Anaerolineales bacterium]